MAKRTLEKTENECHAKEPKKKRSQKKKAGGQGSTGREHAG